MLQRRLLVLGELLRLAQYQVSGVARGRFGQLLVGEQRKASGQQDARRAQGSD